MGRRSPRISPPGAPPSSRSSADVSRRGVRWRTSALARARGVLAERPLAHSDHTCDAFLNAHARPTPLDCHRASPALPEERLLRFSRLRGSALLPALTLLERRLHATHLRGGRGTGAGQPGYPAAPVRGGGATATRGGQPTRCRGRGGPTGGAAGSVQLAGAGDATAASGVASGAESGAARGTARQGRTSAGRLGALPGGGAYVIASAGHDATGVCGGAGRRCRFGVMECRAGARAGGAATGAGAARAHQRHGVAAADHCGQRGRRQAGTAEPR
eukprot:ctg_457.g236